MRTPTAPPITYQVEDSQAVEPIQKPVSIPNSTLLKRPLTIRIKSPSQKVEEIQEIDYGNEPFTQENLDALWIEYAEKIKQESGGFKSSVIANCQPQIQEDGTTIHTIFRTDTNQIEFARLSDNLLTYLKSNLKNNKVNFTWEVNKEKAKRVLYTNREKFDYLSEKFPKLKEWEHKLGLELN